MPKTPRAKTSPTEHEILKGTNPKTSKSKTNLIRTTVFQRTRRSLPAALASRSGFLSESHRTVSKGEAGYRTPISLALKDAIPSKEEHANDSHHGCLKAVNRATFQQEPWQLSKGEAVYRLPSPGRRMKLPTSYLLLIPPVRTLKPKSPSWSASLRTKDEVALLPTSLSAPPGASLVDGAF